MSRERLDAEGVDPEEKRRRHDAKLKGIRLGRVAAVLTWDDARAFCVPSPIAVTDFETYDEDVVKKAVQLALLENGWRIASISWGQEHGTDIVAEREGEVIVLEAKGMRDGQPGFRNYTLQAIGQIAMARESPEWRSALAFPAAAEYVRLLSRLPDWYRSVMSLTVFLVRKEGEAYASASLGPPAAP